MKEVPEAQPQQSSEPARGQQDVVSSQLSQAQFEKPWYWAIGSAFFGVGGAGVFVLLAPFLQNPRAYTSSLTWYFALILTALACCGLYALLAPFCGFPLPSLSKETQIYWRRALALICLGVFVGAFLVNSLFSPKQFVTASPQFLTKIYEGKMTSEAQREYAPYAGKWIRFTGKVSNYEPNGVLGMDILTVTTDDGVDILAYFGGYMGNWFGIGKDPKLQTLRPGDRVQVAGQLGTPYFNVLDVRSAYFGD